MWVRMKTDSSGLNTLDIGMLRQVIILEHQAQDQNRTLCPDVAVVWGMPSSSRHSKRIPNIVASLRRRHGHSGEEEKGRLVPFLENPSSQMEDLTGRLEFSLRLIDLFHCAGKN